MPYGGGGVCVCVCVFGSIRYTVEAHVGKGVVFFTGFSSCGINSKISVFIAGAKNPNVLKVCQSFQYTQSYFF